MARFYESKQFRHIETFWNEVLKESGFDDAEHTKHGLRVLKKSALQAYRDATQETVDISMRYYETLAQKARTTVFPTNLERLVMKMAADGLKNIPITRSLSELGYTTHRLTVMFIIRRYEHEWGLRFWTLKQRNLKHEPHERRNDRVLQDRSA